MKTRNLTYFSISAGLLILFVLYTASVMLIDVQPIGPKGSSVGFATINGWLHNLLSVNLLLYSITDWASLAALLVAVGFAEVGLAELIRRKSLLRVDSSILVLGGFYVLVFSAYLFFEFFVVNYRPVLINGFLEVSYPSSTTMLVMCIMPTAIMQFNRLINNKRARTIISVICVLFAALMVGGRLVSGVHWFTDILGGALLSAALVMLYFAVDKLIEARKHGVERPIEVIGRSCA